jgi:hypothetical protein
MVGPCEAGDRSVNTEAGHRLARGFDIVHVNLTWAEAAGAEGEHVMKLNYTQHPVDRSGGRGDGGEEDATPQECRHGSGSRPTACCGEAAEVDAGTASLTSRPAGLCRSFAMSMNCGGATPRRTRHRRSAYGGQSEAISLIGPDAAGARGWDTVIAGPGPGILGSGTVYGHGGMMALDVLNAAIALDMPAVLSPRLSKGDPRPRHQGLSHHTEAVLALALGEIEVPLPEIRIPPSVKK